MSVVTTRRRKRRPAGPSAAAGSASPSATAPEAAPSATAPEAAPEVGPEAAPEGGPEAAPEPSDDPEALDDADASLEPDSEAELPASAALPAALAGEGSSSAGETDSLTESLANSLAESLPDGDEPDTSAEHHELVPLPPASSLARGEASLARYDPLSAYVQEIRRYPLLSREEEHGLAVRLLDTGDVETARRLVTSNLRLVVKIAHEYRHAYRNILDLVQEGNIGLMQAVQKYDPYRGVKLSSYAAWWIRAYILKFILNNWRLVKIGTTQAQRKLFFNLRREKERLEREGFEVGPKLLAARLQVSEQEVEEMDQRLDSSEVSLDLPVGRDDPSGHTHLDLMRGANQDRPDVEVSGREFRQLLRDKLAEFATTLRGRERTIFENRLLADEPLTLQEIGEKYGISRERARQLEKRLLERVRAYLRRELGDAVEVALGERGEP